MAQAVYPTLMELVRLHGETLPLPSHCFVYGIHLSPLYLTLCLYFPTKTPDRKTKICGWEFRQVVAARYLIACEPHSRNLHENLILLRWRLMISLFTVLKHVQLLSIELPHNGTEANASVSNRSLWWVFLSLNKGILMMISSACLGLESSLKRVSILFDGLGIVLVFLFRRNGRYRRYAFITTSWRH